MEKLFFVASVFILFTISGFAQKKNEKMFKRRDSTAVQSNNFENHFHEFNYLPEESLYPGGNFLMYYNPNIYNMLRTEAGLTPLYKNLSLSNDPLYYYKDHLTKLLAIRYADYNKYDLGVISRYLGMSRKAFAIILAILSLK